MMLRDVRLAFKKSRIGFIGLGVMGKPMAKNLLKAGYHLVVYNRSPQPVRELVKAGAEAGSSPRDVADRSDVVITMLPDSPDVEQVILGSNGVIEGAKPGSIIIDMSSIAPLVSRRIASEVAKKGVEMLDAPVSGGEPRAIDGTLAIMVGGKRSVYERCLDIFKAMGKSIVYVGDNGAGQIAKLANQIIVAANIEAIGEAFVLAVKAGVDPNVLYEAIRGGLAGSAVLDAKAPLIFARNFKPGFRIQLHHKDLKNALETARDLGVPLPVSSLIHQMLIALLNNGKGDLDHSAIVTFIENLAKVEVRQGVSTTPP
jgi:2-hydroxy-3-oxopropionate reductase